VSDTDSARALADRAQIADLIHRYCRAVDRLDVPLGHSIWHDDAWADYGPDVYQGPGKGVIDRVCTQHQHALHGTRDHSLRFGPLWIRGAKAGRVRLRQYVRAMLP